MLTGTKPKLVWLREAGCPTCSKATPIVRNWVYNTEAGKRFDYIEHDLLVRTDLPYDRQIKNVPSVRLESADGGCALMVPFDAVPGFADDLDPKKLEAWALAWLDALGKGSCLRVEKPSGKGKSEAKEATP